MYCTPESIWVAVLVRKEKVKKGSRTWKKRTTKNKGTNPGKKET
jgi:hypothetical protein